MSYYCLQLPPLSAEDHTAKLWLCSKYLETFTRAKERESDFAEVALDLLSRMRHVLLTDRLVHYIRSCNFFFDTVDHLISKMFRISTSTQIYFFCQCYQKLFCDGECFLHIISLLNGTIDDRNGELLLLSVLGVMALLLAGNNESKVFYLIFRPIELLNELGLLVFGGLLDINIDHNLCCYVHVHVFVFRSIECFLLNL